MICPNCGYENENDARFCKRCGVPQGAMQPSAPPPQTAYTQPTQTTYTQPPYGPPQSAYAQPLYTPPAGVGTTLKKKGKAGLIIGICAGVLVIAGVVLALLLLLPSGPSAQGHWVAKSEGMVLILDKDGGLKMYSLAGAADADYDYDKAEGTGSFRADGIKYEFTVEEDRLKLSNNDTDETVRFSRAEEEPDIEEIVTAPLLGLWTNEELGEVIELKEGGKAVSYSPQGEFSGKFEFDIDNGEGVIDLDGPEWNFTFSENELSVEYMYFFKKASDHLDIAAFVAAHSNPLPGIWYDISGIYGTLEFFDDNTYIYTAYGVPTYGTYTFDVAGSTGEIFSDDSDVPGTIIYTDGTLSIDGIYFTQEYVEQPGAEDLYATIIGTWYESGGMGYITFYDDGTFDMYYYDTYYWGSIDYDPFNWSGNITLNTGDSMYFYLLEGTLQFEDMVFTRDYVDTADTVTGIWYDTEGLAGTLDFNAEGTVYASTQGEYVSGTYVFDYDTGTGSMWFIYSGIELSFEFYLDSNLLVVMNEDWDLSAVYTRDYVAQS